MATAIASTLAQAPEKSATWSWVRALFSPSSANDSSLMLQRTSANDELHGETGYELELRELAAAASRESARRRAEANALQEAGLEQMRQADALQTQADYYSHLIR